MDLNSVADAGQAGRPRPYFNWLRLRTAQAASPLPNNLCLRATVFSILNAFRR